jgi:hypothetical protein
MTLKLMLLIMSIFGIGFSELDFHYLDSQLLGSHFKMSFGYQVTTYFPSHFSHRSESLIMGE